MTARRAITVGCALLAVIATAIAIMHPASSHQPTQTAELKQLALMTVGLYASRQSIEITNARVVSIRYPAAGFAVVDVKFTADGSDGADMLVHLTDSRWSVLGPD